MLKWISAPLVVISLSWPAKGADDFYCASRWRFSDSGIQYVMHKRTIDGDTFTVNISGMPGIFGKDIPVRIRGIDAGDVKAKDDCEAKMAVAAATRLHKLLAHAQRIDLSNIDRDKYFRILADVKINGAVDIGSFFTENGWAVRYDGGSKKAADWCKMLKQLK